MGSQAYVLCKAYTLPHALPQTSTRVAARDCSCTHGDGLLSSLCLLKLGTGSLCQFHLCLFIPAWVNAIFPGCLSPGYLSSFVVIRALTGLRPYSSWAACRHTLLIKVVSPRFVLSLGAVIIQSSSILFFIDILYVLMWKVKKSTYYRLTRWMAWHMPSNAFESSTYFHLYNR